MQIDLMCSFYHFKCATSCVASCATVWLLFSALGVVGAQMHNETMPRVFSERGGGPFDMGLLWTRKSGKSLTAFDGQVKNGGDLKVPSIND